MKDEFRWSIHLPSGHCKHEFGLDAYIGDCNSPTIIPLLGPFGPEKLAISERKLAKVNWMLSQTVEQEYDSKYVVWGALSPSIRTSNIEVLGRSTSWIPDPSARLNWAFTSGLKLLGLPNTQIEREWSFTTQANEIHHSSGIGFRYSNDCFSGDTTKMISQISATAFVSRKLDDNVWTPVNLEDGVHALAKVGLKVLCAAQTRESYSRTIKVDLSQELQFAKAS